MDWKGKLRSDAIPLLMASKNPALRYLTRRDLLGVTPGPVGELWHLPAVERILDTQQENGAWRYHGGQDRIRSREDYDQIETYRVLRELVEKYCMNTGSSSLRKAAEFLFSCQTDEGDFRGICGTQYVPYYSAAIMELLIKSGYSEDSRIRTGFEWLISIRQNDGGWAFPLRTVGKKLYGETFKARTVEPDRSKPFSHLVTGIVLRAFAALSEKSTLLNRYVLSSNHGPDRILRIPLFSIASTPYRLAQLRFISGTSLLSRTS
jgi:Squalene-hopene cyclase C-terminal domain